MLKLRKTHRTGDIEVSENEGTCVVACAGVLDIESAPSFREALNAAAGATRQRLVLDLRAVTFIDSTGIGQIQRARKALGKGARLLILTTDQRMRMLLEMAGLAPAGGGALAAA